MDKIAIIDLDSIVFSIGYSKGEEKSEEQLMIDTNSIMNNILINTNSTHYLCYIKGKNTLSNRKLFCEEYKSKRPKESPSYWKFVKEYLINNWKAVEVNNMEVDDAVNITRLKLKDSFICCIDSDLLGLEGTHYNWRKSEWINTSKEESEYNFWSSLICGTHNGIKGIPKRGKKFVEKLFSKYDQYGENRRNLVLDEYINYYGEFKGIKEFYNNYNCIKLLENDENFVIPSPIEMEIDEF